MRQINDQIMDEQGVVIDPVDPPASTSEVANKEKQNRGGNRGGGFGNNPTSRFEVIGHELQAMKQVVGNIGSQLTNPGTWKWMWKDVEHPIPVSGVNPGRPGFTP